MSIYAMQARSVLSRPLGRSLTRYLAHRQRLQPYFLFLIAVSSLSVLKILSMELTNCWNRTPNFPAGVAARMKAVALMQSASTACKGLGRRRYAHANHLQSIGVMIRNSLLNGPVMRRWLCKWNSEIWQGNGWSLSDPTNRAGIYLR